MTPPTTPPKAPTTPPKEEVKRTFTLLKNRVINKKLHLKGVSVPLDKETEEYLRSIYAIQ